MGRSPRAQEGTSGLWFPALKCLFKCVFERKTRTAGPAAQDPAGVMRSPMAWVSRLQGGRAPTLPLTPLLAHSGGQGEGPASESPGPSMAQHPRETATGLASALCGLYSHSLGVGGFVACAKLYRLPISSMTTSRELGPRWPPACPTAQPGGGCRTQQCWGGGRVGSPGSWS